MAKKVEKKPARKRKPAAKKVVAKKVAQPRIPAWARSLRTDCPSSYKLEQSPA